MKKTRRPESRYASFSLCLIDTKVNSHAPKAFHSLPRPMRAMVARRQQAFLR